MKYVFVLVLSLLFFSCVTESKKNSDMVANIEPLPAGNITAGYDKSFSSEIDAKDIALVFHPRNNTVVLEFSYQLTKYKQYWSFNDRQLFIEAVDSYLSEFEDRSLVNQASKTEKKYGSFRGMAEWGTMFYNSLSRPQVTLGYVFNNENPYFIVVQRPAPNERADEMSMPQNNSLGIQFFFTRRQAQKLAELFAQEYLLNLIPGTAEIQETMNLADEY